ncbi:MAG TPA: LysR substrate-binding domain-containing protein [Gemmatimonadales bacterium]|nr:LysR substrate-binding domain-containing protein [Gemmatimonadales bacterium]
MPDDSDMGASVELRQLRYFIAVAEELSFTRAARRLGMAQPPLSQQIRRLEQLVGVRLFRRVPSVALTEAGVVFLESARRTLAQLALGVDNAGRVGRGVAGRLTVGFASSVVFTGLPQAFRAFSTRYPEVELELREMHSGAQLAALRAGTIDVALLRESPSDAELEMEVVFREPFVAVLPRRHRLAARSSLAPRQLASEPFILFPRELAPTLHDQISAVCRAGDFSPQVKHEALEWFTVTGLVGAGLGVSIAPAGLARLRWRGVVYRPIKPVEVQTSIVLCRRREPNRGVVELFVELLRHVGG